MNTISNKQIIGCKHIHFKQLYSTNDHALKLIAKSNPIEGTVISTDFQSAGKGQRSNKWQSEQDKNLLLSIILYPFFLSIEQQFYLGMFTAIAIAELVKGVLPSKNIKVKWPNDIFVDQKKIAGILIQNNIRGSSLESAVIGIGLNVNQIIFDSTLPNPTSLTTEKNQIFDLRNTLADLLLLLDKNYLLLKNGDFEHIKAKYESLLLNKGINSCIKTRDKWVEGVILGIEEDGRILIDEQGSVAKYFY